LSDFQPRNRPELLFPVRIISAADARPSPPR
jgi:hypothetical protein